MASSTSDDNSFEVGQVSLYASAFRRLSEKPATTIRFFDKNGDGDMFIVYNQDAHIAAKEVYQTNAVIKKAGSGKDAMEYALINRSHFESFVRDLLLARQLRVEVYVNESGSKNKIEWVAKYKGSPGNLGQFEDILFSNNEMTVNNGVIGIKVGAIDRSKTIGVAHVNMNECQIHLIEFCDNDSLTNFESVLVQLSPKEAVLSVSVSQNDDFLTLRKILERNGILINDRKSSDFDTKDIDQDLSKLLQVDKATGKVSNVSAHPEMEKTLAVSGLAGVIKYLELMSGDTHLHQFSFQPFNFGLHVKMDSSACRALHLSMNSIEKTSRNDTTLLSVVDKCRTAQGHRLLAQYLKQPILSKEKLEERLDLVQILVEDVVLRQSLHEDHLRKVPDCQTIARKLLKKKASLQDCYRAYLFLTKLKKMLDELESHESDRQHVLKSWIIDPLKSLYSDLAKFKELIETILDLEMADKGEFIVQPGFDEVLQELKKDMDVTEVEMGDLLYKVAKSLSLEANKSIKLESSNANGYVFRVTLKEETAIRNSKEFVVLHSTKSGVEFRNKNLEILSDRYLKKRAQYEQEQKGIVDEMFGVAVDYHPCFEQLGHIVAELDVFTSFAFVSANSPMPYVRPKLLSKGSGIIKFEGLRHPCVESQPNVNFIPNDLHFEQGKQSFYIITGPNMGGKSTFLRSVGVATLLAHVGCFVPALEAEVSIVDAILARVGASDSLTKGVSTFMAEMIETSFILKTATSDSLVIIDELGRGTSTYDGFGLCWAISEHLAKSVGCYCVLATHFHELTALADEIPTVVNYHVTAVADDNGLTMLYKIEKGPCDRSFGIHVASHVGFPDEVINKARDMAKVLEDFCQEDDKDDDEVAVKKRRDFKTDGQKVIDEFLENVRTCFREQVEAKENGNITETEADATLKARVDELLSEINEKALKNPYLHHLLQQSNYD